MLLRNALTPQQGRKDSYFFLSYLSNRALYHYHPQAEELVSASESCSSTIVFAAKPRFTIHKYFSHGYSLNVSPDLATEEYLVILTNLFSPNPIALRRCLNVIVFQKRAHLVTNRLFLHILVGASKKKKIRAQAVFKKKQPQAA